MIRAARPGILAQDDTGPVDRGALDPTRLGDRKPVFDRPYGRALARKERRDNGGRQRNDQKRCYDRCATLTPPKCTWQHQSRTE